MSFDDFWKAYPSTPRKAVFGTTAMPLDLRYHESSGTNQEYVDYIIAVAAHKVKSIDEIWFEEKLAWSASGGVTATYSGYLTVTTRTEGTAANTIAINGGTKWGTSRRLTGCAYVHLRIKRTGNTKTAESPLVGGLPSRVTIIGDGAALYDPRKDSTVPGGSGSHRATDQTTWGVYTDADDTDNPALQLLWWLLGWKINGKLSVGAGVPYTRIDMESFITAANICDESVTLATGGTQKRYRTSGTASDADDRMDIINNFLNHESVPMGMEKYEHKVEVNPKDDVPGVQPVAEKMHTFQTIMEDALEGLKNIPSDSKMEWKPVTEPIDETKYETFTLLRVEDWKQRYGFGVHYCNGWRLRDPYNKEADTAAESRITHWLAIPLSLRKSMNNTKVC